VYLNEDVKKCLSAMNSRLRGDEFIVFDQMMALRGECFRHQEGRLTQRVLLGNKFYFLKQHRGVGWKDILKNILQLRWPVLGAYNEKQAIEKLQSLGLSVPSIAAFGQRGINPAKLQSFILMEEVAPSLSLEDVVKTWHIRPPTFSLKRKLIEEVARIARTLHQSGVNHRDFYICHFLLDTTQGLDKINDKNVKLHLIDLHRAQIRRLTPQRWIIKDLAGLYFSSKHIGLTQRDFYRFMKAYTLKSLREIRDSNHFWQKVRLRGERLYSDHTKCY
jgi:heptose I phosphotransferase